MKKGLTDLVGVCGLTSLDGKCVRLVHNIVAFFLPDSLSLPPGKTSERLLL